MEGRPPDEDALVERARRGDDRAFEMLLEQHVPLAHRLALLVAGDLGDAEDALQDACVKALRALPRFRPGAPFRPWLLAIVVNEARNRRRSGRRGQALSVRLAAASRSGDAAPSPEVALLERERRGELLTALRALAPNDRDVIACRFLLELSEAETGVALGLAHGTVKSRTSRALARLRERMEGA